MSVGESFGALFASANILTMCLWAVGFVLVIAEIFMPMRKISYILGASLILTAFVTHTIYGTPGEAFVFVFLTALCLFAAHFASLALQKRDWLRVARLARAGSKRRYGSLIGSVGVANTSIAFTGSVTVNDVNLVAYSETPISPGSKVRIVEVSADRITVVPVVEVEEQNIV